MRPLVKYWHSKAIRIAFYLDDGISAATNFSKCQGDSLLGRFAFQVWLCCQQR